VHGGVHLLIGPVVGLRIPAPIAPSRAKHGIVKAHAHNGHAWLNEEPPTHPAKHCSRWDRLRDRAAEHRASRREDQGPRPESKEVWCEDGGLVHIAKPLRSHRSTVTRVGRLPRKTYSASLCGSSPSSARTRSASVSNERRMSCRSVHTRMRTDAASLTVPPARRVRAAAPWRRTRTGRGCAARPRARPRAPLLAPHSSCRPPRRIRRASACEPPLRSRHFQYVSECSLTPAFVANARAVSPLRTHRSTTPLHCPRVRLMRTRIPLGSAHVSHAMGRTDPE
jgi:hypothetical protein